MSEEIISDPVLLQENRNLQILQKSLAGALKDVFGEYTESQRFLDLKRIPLICKDISNISINIKDIKDAMSSSDGDFEKRLRSIERNQAWYMGAAAILGALGMFALQHFVK